MNPKTLEEAIKFGLMVGPLSEVVERTKRLLREFMATKFQAAMFRQSDPALEAELRQLFKEIFGDETP